MSSDEAYAKEFERESQEKTELQKSEQGRELSVWDYVVLEFIWRKDPRILLRIGTMRTVDIIHKLFQLVLVKKLSEPSFDEMERHEALLDSPEYKQYKKRRERIMTSETRNKIDFTCGMIKIENIDDMLEPTEAGSRKMRKKRAEMRLLWRKLEDLCDNDRAKFQQKAKENLIYLPLLIAMGMASGAAMVYMASEASTDHMYGIHEIEYSSLRGDPGHGDDPFSFSLL